MNTTTRATSWINRIDQFELPVCLYVNRANNYKLLNILFRSISRLGDGIFWYSLIASTTIVFGNQALLPALNIIFTAGLGVVIYKGLKERLVRERPFISYNVIKCNTRALDRYSFPSGHTLHAVNFSILLSFYYPNLIWIVTTFALLVTMSRLILGLHYISDVIVGGLIGAALAIFSLQFYQYWM